MSKLVFWVTIAAILIGWKLYASRRSPEQLAELQAAVDAGALLLDVRSAQEFATGHLPGARNVPVGDVGAIVDELKGQTVLVYCASGMRSAKAARQLRAAGVQALDLRTLANGRQLKLPADASS